MKTIPDITRKLIGKICWGVKWDCQLNLSMNFGDPHLEINRKPHTGKQKTKRAKERSLYRHVTICGEWWLWIFCAQWKLVINDSIAVTNSSSNKNMMMAFARLEGQKLSKITITPANGFTDFNFDLGAHLTAKRLDEDYADIWTLYKHHGNILGIQGIGTFTYSPGDIPGDKEVHMKMEGLT